MPIISCWLLGGVGDFDERRRRRRLKCWRWRWRMRWQMSWRFYGGHRWHLRRGINGSNCWRRRRRIKSSTVLLRSVPFLSRWLPWYRRLLDLSRMAARRGAAVMTGSGEVSRRLVSPAAVARRGAAVLSENCNFFPWLYPCPTL